MIPRYHGRTDPGAPADWQNLPVVGGCRRSLSPGGFWLMLGMLLGMIIAAVLR